MSDTPRKLRVIDSPDPERPPPTPEEPRPKLRLGAKEFTEVNRPQEATTRPITVHGILADNLRHTVPSEKPMDLRRRLSRRARDYWLCLILGDGLFLTPLLLLPRNPMVVLFAVGGAVVFTAALTWIMWQLMSDY
ncbi:MAG TPA: hypothetical protein VK178_16750 [Opitutaceae bacterium]|nr:hypothetical protein [Opitutaceae bacterium]